MKNFQKKKEGQALGFRTPDFLRGSKFGGKRQPQRGKFIASQFHTQHKGGS
ncbi:hypothetical protein MUP46_00155 [Patescibacteria group bacterium]|nr:hypothetical protein [Patescibacteria group bacterium]